MYNHNMLHYPLCSEWWIRLPLDYARASPIRHISQAAKVEKLQRYAYTKERLECTLPGRGAGRLELLMPVPERKVVT